MAAAALVACGYAAVHAAEPLAVLDDFGRPEAWQVWPEAWGGKAKLAATVGPAPGTAALRFTGPGIAYRELAVAEADARDWAGSTGVTFQVKGDGSALYGTIVVGPAGKGSWEQGFVNSHMTGHAFYFPLANTAWHTVTARFSEFVPEGPHPAIGEPGGLAPADIRVLRFGNRWKYWRNYDVYPRFSYEVARVTLLGPEPSAAGGSGTAADRDAKGGPATLAAVLENMRSGRPVRILCAGDSITAGAGVDGGKRYWELLQGQLRDEFDNDRITVEGWGIGGATMLDALPWVRWMLGTDPPDLVTVMYGTNDCNCYPPGYFRRCVETFLDRIATASAGRTAVLPFATLPGKGDFFTKTDPYAEVVRQVMRRRGQPFFDLSQALKAKPDSDFAACFADGVHLNAAGHLFVAGALHAFLTAEPVPPRPAVLEGVRRILFLGDSLTDGSSYPDYVVNTLGKLYPEGGFELFNAAGAGDTAGNLRARLAADVLTRDPDLVVICIGTNDCNTGRTPEDYRADLDAVVASLAAAGSRVMLVRPSPFGDAAREARFQAYLAAIDAGAKARDLPVADAHGLFLTWMKDGREPLGADGIHHGKDGFECMARAVLEGLGLGDVPLDMDVRPWPGLLTGWDTSDPVPAGTPPDPAAAKGWKHYDAAALAARQPWWNSPFPKRGAWMPFDDANPKEYAYGRTAFDAPAAGDYELRIGGSPNPQLVWVNGEKVWEGRRNNGYHPDADRVTVRLNAGRNEIVAASNFMLFVGVYAK
jgi:lysophospholipase L1-like esterase